MVLAVPAVLCALALTVSGCGREKRGVEGSESGLFTGELTGGITVSAYKSGSYRNFLEETARRFEVLHPGATVTVDTFSAMPEIRSAEQGGSRVMLIQDGDDPQGRADYIGRVNTSLMSGAGADIYAMDVLPLYKFIQGGQLENLETYMNGDPGFNRADYRDNILEALRYREGVWFMPTDYTFNYFAYDSALFPETGTAGFGTGKAWTAGELLAMGEQYFDGSAKLFNLVDYSPGGGLAFQVLSENIQTYVDFENKKANFLNGGFAGLLESIRRAGEGGYVSRGVTGREDAEGLMRQAGREETGRFFFKLKNNFSLVSWLSRGTGRRMMMWSGDEISGIEDDDEIAGIAAGAGGRIPFQYNQAYGISSGSKNKALAWAFIKFLLDEETQLSTALPASALPLNNKAREQKAEQVFSGAFMGRETPLDAGLEAALKKYTALTEALSDQINCFAVQDTAIHDMITAEWGYFFTGAKTATEVAAVLQNKVDLYLNE
jgi:ABC-type glycerol-3-phosphate transport system substrate-binding protein